MNYHLLEPEQKFIFQSPRTRPRCSPKVFLSTEFIFVLRNIVTLNYRRFFLLLVAKAKVSARLSAMISKLKCGVLWLICPLEEAGIHVIVLITHFLLVFVYDLLEAA